MGSSNMPIPLYKAEWIICGSCFCENCYCLSPTTCCAAEDVCLCFGADWACIPVPEQTPKICALWCLACYPQVGCCKSVRELYEGDDAVLNGLNDVKEEFYVCTSGCCGPICAGNGYCLIPFTCCYSERQQLCCATDCAFPCNDKVPMALTCICPGLAVYPEVGCCKTVQDLFPNDIEAGSSAAPV